MGNCCFPNKPTRIVMMGLDNAGKTTILSQLKHGEATQHNGEPTIGRDWNELDISFNNNCHREIW